VIKVCLENFTNSNLYRLVEATYTILLAVSGVVMARARSLLVTVLAAVARDAADGECCGATPSTPQVVQGPYYPTCGTYACDGGASVRRTRARTLQ
jgi:hypothetical protein